MDVPAFLLDSTGEQTPLEGEVTIGRMPGVTLWLDDPAVSRRHAVIRPSGSGFEIEDLHSANGTYVNDDLIERPVLLRAGDRITIGSSDFAFTLAAAAPAPALPEAPAIRPAGADLLIEPSLPEVEEADDRTLYAPLLEEEPLAFTAESETDARFSAPVAEEEPPRAAPNFSSDPDSKGEEAPVAPNLLQLAARVARLVHETDDLAELLRLVAQMLAESYMVDAAGFYLAGQHGADLICAIADGKLASSLLGARATLGRGVVGSAAAENLPTRRDGAEAAEDADLLVAGLRSFLAAPVALRDGAVVCVLALINPAWKLSFDDDDLDFAALLGQQLVAAAPARGNWEMLARQVEAAVRAQSVRRSFVTVQPGLYALANRAFDAIGSGQPVYLWGESGSWRRHLARIANLLAGGEAAPFVVVDCAGLDGAGQREAIFGAHGAWEQAGSGLLYLAQAAALDPEVAQQLVERFTQPGSPRVVFAGDEPPSKSLAGLEGIQAAIGDRAIHLPPLRERQADIAPLARHFARKLAERYEAGQVGFDAEALQQLGQYQWPGNVAELEALILRAAILSDIPMIDRVALVGLAPELAGPSPRSVAEQARWERLQRLCLDLTGEDRTVQEARLTELRQLPAAERTVALGLLLGAVESAIDPGERARRLALLARAGDGRIARYAAGFLADADQRLRQTAIVALTEGAAPAWAVERLREAAAGDETQIASLALLALGRLRDLGALGLLRRALLESDDERLRVLAAAAIAQYDPAEPEVRALWRDLLQRAEVLPARVLSQALGGGALTNENLRRLLTERALSGDGKARLIRLVGQADDAGALELLVELAPLAIDDPVQSALAEQIARRGERAVALLPRLLGAAQPGARAVGILVLRRLSASQLAAALGDPSLLSSLRDLASAHPEALRSAIADAVYSDWRVEPILQLLRILSAGDQQ